MSAVPRVRLEEERRRLLVELKRALADYEAGLLPLSEYESTELVLRYRLEVIYEALGVPPDPVAPEASEEARAEDGSGLLLGDAAGSAPKGRGRGRNGSAEAGAKGSPTAAARSRT
jgi:hypothetical protein